MLSVILPLLSVVALSAAHTSLAPLWIPETAQSLEPKDVVASVVGSDATATTYMVNCASKAASNKLNAALTKSDLSFHGACGLAAPITIAQGPSTVKWTYGLSNGSEGSALASVQSANCVLSGTTEAICTMGTGEKSTYGGKNMMFTPISVEAGAVTATSASASTTGHLKKALSSSGTGSAPTMSGSFGLGGLSSGSSGLRVFSNTSSISGVYTAKPSTPTSALPKSTNFAVQGSPSRGSEMVGALVIALAGAVL